MQCPDGELLCIIFPHMPRQTIYSMGLFLLLAGCSSTWATLPRIGQSREVAEKPQVISFKLAEVREKIARRQTLLFDASKASGDAIEVVAGDDKTSLLRSADGLWHVGSATGPRIDLLAFLSAGNTASAVTVANKRVCHATCPSTTLAACGLLNPPGTPSDTMRACYEMIDPLPAPPFEVAATLDATQTDIWWIPTSSSGEIDATRLGFAWRGTFSMSEPRGGSTVAKIKITVPAKPKK